MALKKHVITGAQCTGKTTTIEALKKRGFKIIREASRILIDEQNKKKGDLVPWKRLFDFNVKLAELQIELESQAKEGIYFADRGIIDALAYCEWGAIAVPPNLQEAVKKARYDKVFLLQPLPHYEKDPIRQDTREDQKKLHSLIKKAYQKHGYEVIEVPPWSVEERVEFILKEINATSE